MGVEDQSYNSLTLSDRRKQIDFEVEKEKNEIFDIIRQEIGNFNEDDLLYVFESLLSLSLEDGMYLMSELGIPKIIWIDCITSPRFFVKHPDFVKRFRHLINSDDEVKTDILAKYYIQTINKFPLREDNNYLIGDKKANPYISFYRDFHTKNESIQYSEKANLIVKKLNNLYGKYIRLLDNDHIWEVKKHCTDDRSEGIKFGEDDLFPMVLRIWKYYPKNFIEIIYDTIMDSSKDTEYLEKQKYVYNILDKAYRNKLEKGFISAEDVKEIVQFLVNKNLINKNDVEYIYRKLKYYRPLDTVLHAKVLSAKDKNIKELKQLLETYYGEDWEQNISLEINYDTGLYEIKKTKDIIDEREEIEISKKYDHIRHGNIVDGNIYLEATIYDKNTGIEHRILKNGKEILNEYDDLGTCGYINGKIYHTGKKDNKLILFENGVRILDQYDEIKFYEIIDKNIYCVVSKNGKYILLKNNEEISAEYDEIKFCDLVEPEYTYSEKERNTRMNIGKRFIGVKNNKWVLLKGEKEVSDEYDKIIYHMTKDGHVYYIASIGRKKCYLKDGKKISGEYDDIIYGGIENGQEYFKAKINHQWFVVKNGKETPVKHNINLYAGKTFFYYIVGGKDYLLVIDDGRYFVEENGEVVSKVYDDYQNYFTSISNGKLYWCIEKYHDYVLLENGKELLSGYSHIDFCESVGGHTYCAAKKDNKRVLFKDWNEVLTGYDEIRFREKVDGNIYYFAKKDGKIYLVKNGEIFTQGYDEFKYSRQGTRFNGKLYSIVTKNKKQLLLENEMEISKKYNNVYECGILDGKIYHTAEKSSGTGVLLENGREILEGYDNIWVREKTDGNIYCLGKRGKSDVILENRKEISKEYDDIHYCGLIDGNLYYTAESNKESVLIENKIKDSNELKLPNHIKSKLDFLNLCMSCGKLTTENLLEVQSSINEYMVNKYSKEKLDDYSYNGLLGFFAKRLSSLFTIMLKKQPEELVNTINYFDDRETDEKYAKYFFNSIFKSKNIGKTTNIPVKQRQLEMGQLGGPDTTRHNSIQIDLQKILKGDGLNEASLNTNGKLSKNTNKYSIIGDISVETYNNVNLFLTLYQYSGFDFHNSTQETIKRYLIQEANKLRGDIQELNHEGNDDAGKLLLDKFEDFVSKTRFVDKLQGCEELEKAIGTIKDNLGDEEYQKLISLIEYIKKE